MRQERGKRARRERRRRTRRSWRCYPFSPQSANKGRKNERNKCNKKRKKRIKGLSILPKCDGCSPFGGDKKMPRRKKKKRRWGAMPVTIAQQNATATSKEIMGFSVTWHCNCTFFSSTNTSSAFLLPSHCTFTLMFSPYLCVLSFPSCLSSPSFLSCCARSCSCYHHPHSSLAKIFHLYNK